MDINPLSSWHDRRFREATGGFFPADDDRERRIESLDPWDNVRRDMLILLLRSVIERRVEGDFAELGVYRGQTAKLIHHYAPERKLHLFDTFEGFDTRDAETEAAVTGAGFERCAFRDTSLNDVKQHIAARNDTVRFYQGYFPESVPERLRAAPFAFVHIDVDLYQPTYSGLEFFFERLAHGGIVVIHDYNAWLGARRAVDEFFTSRGKAVLPMPDKSGSAVYLNS